MECARAVALDKLRKKLTQASTKAGAGAPPPQAFERWRFAATLEGNAKEAKGGATTAMNDPVVPSSVELGPGSALQQLTQDLTRAGVPPESARAAATATATNANTEALALKKLGDRLKTLAKTGDASSKDASKESKESTEQKEHQNQLRLVTIAATFRKRSVELHSDKGKHFVVLSRRAYGKLAVMFRATCVLLKDEKSLLPLGEVDAKFLTEFALRKKQKNESEKPEKPVSKVQKLVDSEDEDEGDDSDDDQLNDSGTVTQEELETLLGESESAPAPGAKRTSFTSARTAFHERLFALLLRYKSILGYGFQAGVGPLVFSALQKTIGTQFELFASPLNAFHTKGFCSAFPDVDGCFGSRGDFFDIFEHGKIKRGAFQVNPPFVSETMTKAVSAIEKALREADKNEEPLSFTVFVPGWSDEPAWQKLVTSKFTRNNFIVAAADHGYCDGAAHQRKSSFRSSTYDTGVFFLCSKKALGTQSGKKVTAKGGSVFETEIRTAFAGARFSKEEAGAVSVKLANKKRQREDTSNPLIRQFDKDTNETPEAANIYEPKKSDDGKKGKKSFDKKDRKKGDKKEMKKEGKAAKKRRKKRAEKAKEEPGGHDKQAETKAE